MGCKCWYRFVVEMDSYIESWQRYAVEYKVCMICCFVPGLHINLSEGVPVSSVQAVSSLLSSDKVFLGKAGIRSALENGALNMDEVYLLIYLHLSSKF